MHQQAVEAFKQHDEIFCDLLVGWKQLMHLSDAVPQI